MRLYAFIIAFLATVGTSTRSSAATTEAERAALVASKAAQSPGGATLPAELPDTFVEVCHPRYTIGYDPEWPDSAGGKRLNAEITWIAAEIVRLRAKMGTAGTTNKQKKAYQKHINKLTKKQAKLQGQLDNTGRSSCTILSTSQAQTAVTVADEDSLVIRVYDEGKPVPLGRIQDLVVKAQIVGEQRIVEVPSDFDGEFETKKYTMIEFDRRLIGARPGQKIRIIVNGILKPSTAGGAAKQLEQQSYIFNLNSRPKGYGLSETYEVTAFRGDWIGVWAPVGLFGANTRAVDESGLKFAAVPFAGAVGTKLYYRTHYIGVSLFAAPFTFTQTQSNEPATDPTDTGDPDDETTSEEDLPKDDSFSLVSVSAGLLLDFDHKFHVGVGYTWDVRKLLGSSELRDGLEHPGLLLTVGLPTGFGAAQ